MSSERIIDAQDRDPLLDPNEAAMVKALDENENTIAGHTLYKEKTDPKNKVHDGLLRTLNLQRDAKRFLLEQVGVLVDEVSIDDEIWEPGDLEWWSYDDLIHGYKLVRERHNRKYAGNKSEVEIPHVDRKYAHEFLQAQLAEGRVLLAKDHRVEEIDFQKNEDVRMFRFPPSEYVRKRGELEVERDALKDEAVQIEVDLAEQRFTFSGNDGDRWTQAKGMVSTFVGLKKHNKYNGDVGMYLSEISAEAYLRGKVESGEWETTEAENPLTHRIETFYRPIRQEEPEE